MKACNIIVLFNLFIIGVVSAQEGITDGGAQANNPLANMIALNIQNYYTPVLTNAPKEAYANSSWIRFASPLLNGKLLFRLSVPINTVAFPDSTGTVNAVNGLGDVNALLTYNFISKPNATVGLGPLVIAPSAQNEFLGSEKWQVGLALVVFVVKSPQFQLGGLVTWQMAVAGNSNRAQTNNTIFQPFYFWQLGKGTYLRGAPAFVFNLTNGNYAVPFALGIGKVVKVGKTVFNCFIEPQYAMLHKGRQPQFQLFAGINLQFIKSPKIKKD